MNLVLVLVLFGDTFTHIKIYLTLYDLHMLSYVNKHYNRINVKKIIIDRINKYLECDLLCDINVFKKYMEDNKVYIHGKYIEHCLTHKTCENKYQSNIQCAIKKEYYSVDDPIEFHKIIGNIYLITSSFKNNMSYDSISSFQYTYRNNDSGKNNITYTGIDKELHTTFDKQDKLYIENNEYHMHMPNFKKLKYN